MSKSLISEAASLNIFPASRAYTESVIERRERYLRLSKFEADALDISRLHLTTASFGIHDGLLEQAHNFLARYPNTNLIVIDTLEHIRNGGMEKTLYSYDYQDMTKLREITSRHRVTLMLVHHTRKTSDPDPLNIISGSTGLIGAVDGVFVLEKINRTGNGALLTIANRDMAVFGLAQNVVNASAGLIVGDLDLGSPEMMEALAAQLETMEIGALLGLWLQIQIIGLCLNIMAIVIFIVIWGRMMEIYLTVSIAPIPFSTMVNREWSGMGKDGILAQSARRHGSIKFRNK